LSKIILPDGSPDKPAVDYPCDWQFKVIGENVSLIQQAIREILDKKEYDLQASNISLKGKYKSLSLVVNVASQNERDTIFKNLSESNHIKMVL